MELINRRQGVRSSKDRKRVIRHEGKYYTDPLPLHTTVQRFHRDLPPPRPEGLVPAVAKTYVLSLLKSFNSTSLEETISASPGTVPHNIKLVAGASASAQTLGEADVSSLKELNTASLQELVTTSTRTAPCNNTLDGLLTTSPFRCEKTVAGVAESAHAQAMRELELDQLIAEERLSYSSSEDPTTTSPRAVENNAIDGSNQQTLLQTLQDAHVSSSEELINTASLEESITASPPIALCNTSRSPFSCENIVAGLAESARSQALQELDLELDQFLAEERLGDSSSEDLTTSQRAVEHNAIDSKNQWTVLRNTTDGRNQRTVLRNTTDGILSSASSLGSKILSRQVPHCFYWYYTRMDGRGSFRTYPDRGGPFQSLQEAEDAIDRYHDGFWCQSWRDVQERLQDGGPYLSSRKVSEVDAYRYLVEALLDQYNEDNNLIGNLGHEVDGDVMMEQCIYEDHTWYYHYNFTTKKKNAGDIFGACTFFTEVSHKLGEDALEVNCCCKMEDEDNGWCYGCKNNGSHGMRHPKNSDAYIGGHEDVFLPFDLEEPSSSDDEEAKETRLWNLSKENPLSCVSGSLFLQQANTVEC